MQLCRSVSTALGIVLAVAAMPAAADWKNFFIGSNSAPSVESPYIPDTLLDQDLSQDDPLDLLPDSFTESNDSSAPDSVDESLPFDPPLLAGNQSDSVYSDPQTSSVPEPGTISLFARALLGMGLSMAYRRQRKARAAR